MSPVGVQPPAPFTVDDYLARGRRVVAAATEAGLTGVLVTPGPDLVWLTGYQPTAITERLTVLVLTPDEEPTLLVDAVSALALPEGRGHAFVHGEASSVRELRRHLVAERGLEPDQLSISGYWKRKRTEDGWREDKAEWNRLVAADVAAA